MSTTIHVGNALDVLAGLPSESVHCCVTSPPYWGLRSYHLQRWDGGDPDCEHQLDTQHQKQGATSIRKGRSNVESQRNEAFKEECSCGAQQVAVDGGIGLEPTFDEHLANLMSVFREVRRVLRSDGTLWLNYGDAYARGDNRGGSGSGDKQASNTGSAGVIPRDVSGLKPKDLMMMPARVAMALQADGWWLRSEIVWHKPNPMPESVTDRPTNAHEKLFLLTKSAKYFYDAEAVRKPSNGWAGDFKPKCPERMEAQKFGGTRNEHNQATANLRNVWTIPTHSFKEAHFATFPPALVEPCIKAGTSERGVCGECGAPWKRQVDVSHENPGNRTTNGPRSEAQRHETAGFSQRLEKRSTTTGWAPTCCDCHVPIMTPVPDGDVRPDPTMQTGRKGLNRERNTNATRAMTRGEQRDYARQIRESENREQIRDLAGDGFDHYVRTDQSGARPLPPDVLAQCIERGWLKPASAQCDCACKDAGDPVPATVLDPFAGSGTVGLVADRLQRDSILIELSPEYAEMAGRRIKADAPLLANVVEAGDTL